VVALGKRVNDNDDERLKLLQERIRSAIGLHAVLEVQTQGGAKLSQGKVWKSQEEENPVHPDRHDQDPMLSCTIDVIGPLIRHLDGRLRVDDFSAFFTTAEDELIGLEDPSLSEKIRLCRSWYWRWKARSNPVEWFADLSYRRIVCGFAYARWRFADGIEGAERYNGMRLDPCIYSRLTTDPANPIQDLWEHTWTIDTYALPLSDAMAAFSPYLTKYPRGLETFKSGKRLGDLAGGEMFLADSLFGLRPGASMSTTPAVLCHEMFDERWTKLVFVLQLPPWYDAQTHAHHDSEYFILYDGPWDYGCPYLKLDAYKNIGKAYGDSFALALAGPQNIISMGIRWKIRTAFFSTWQKILMSAGVLESEADEDALTSNEPLALVKLNRKVEPGKVIQPMTFGRIDPAIDDLIGLSFDAAFRTSSVTPVLQGEAKDRETGMGYIKRLQQALVPMESMGHLDQQRVQRFAANAAEANMLRASRVSKRKALVAMYGARYSRLLLHGNLDRIAAAGPVVCHMKDGAFRSQTREEKEDKLFALLTSGRVDPMDPGWLQERFLQTGWEAMAGQADQYFSALEKVRSALSGERPTVGSYDPHDWIIRIGRHYLATAILSDYTADQIEGLEMLLLSCEREKFRSAQMDAAQKQLFSAETGRATGAPSEGAPAATPAPTAISGPQGAPMVGELAGVTG